MRPVLSASILLAVGCTPTELQPSPSVPAVTTSTSPVGPPAVQQGAVQAVVSASLAPPSSEWVLSDAGYRFSVELVGDVNGDGWVDARVVVNSSDYPGPGAMLVYGPLVRSLTLPAEADVQLFGGNLAPDHDGDGIRDYVFIRDDANGDDERAIAYGPPDPVMDDSSVDTAWGVLFSYADVDHDGVADRIETRARAVDVWFGDVDTWTTRPPDLTAVQNCNWSDPDVDLKLSHDIPDADGDGVREIEFFKWVFYEDPSILADPTCGDVMVSAAARGVVDLRTDPQVWYGVDLQVVGDVDGDGISDFGVADGTDRVFLSAPVAFTGQSFDLAASTVAFVQDASIEATLIPLGADLDGDGIGELWHAEHAAVSSEPSRYTIYTGGAAGGAATGALWSEHWFVGTVKPLVEDGELYFLVYDWGQPSVRARTVHVGPATAVPVE